MRVELVLVEGADEPSALDVALAEGSVLVGTAVVEGAVAALVEREHDDVASGEDCLYVAFFQIIGVGDAIPVDMRHGRMIARPGAIEDCEHY
jgi:hypothetical protein